MRKSKRATGKRKLFGFNIEPLESRRLLSTWSTQDQLIGLDKAVQNYPTVTGAGETVVLIDHGVDYNHPALGGGVGAGHKIIAAYNFADETPDVFPYNGDAHGTGSAGQVAGNLREVNGQVYQGVAPGVNLVALKISDTNSAVQAFDWVIAHRSQYNIVAVNYVDPSGQVNGASLVNDLQMLRNQSVFVAGPAGNYGPSAVYPFWNHLLYLVGSETLGGQISTFTPRGAGIDMVAPGENVDITWYANGQSMDYPSSGTSWAGPQVVGAAALIKQVDSSFTPDEIMSILRDSAHRVADSYSGISYPALDVNAAIGLAYARAQGVTAPTPPPVSIPTPPPVSAPTPPPVTAPTPPPVVTPTPAPVVAEKPFMGTAFSTGQNIPAADFDTGGEGIAYHDDTRTNDGGGSLRKDGVDTRWTSADGGSEFVGWTQAGEWMKYTVTAAKAGTFSIGLREASDGAGGVVHFLVDGQTATHSSEIPSTGGWDSYATIAAGSIHLSAGTHTIELAIDKVGASGYAGNFDWFRLDAGGVLASSRRSIGHHAGGSVGATPHPLNVTALSTNSLLISWGRDEFGGMKVALERSVVGKGKWKSVHNVATKSSNAGTSYTDTGLSMGVSYDYWLKVVTSRGKTYHLDGSGTTATRHLRHHLGRHHARAA